MDLFAYGTLMDREIFRVVSGELRPARAAVLAGYVRRFVRNEEYPAIVPRAGGSVDGVLYAGVSATAWERLDLFEGAAYTRSPVEVSPEGSAPVRAFAYVLRPTFHEILSERDWSFATFLLEGRDRFLARYAGFARLRR